jgi:hypothetical protein
MGKKGPTQRRQRQRMIALGLIEPLSGAPAHVRLQSWTVGQRVLRSDDRKRSCAELSYHGLHAVGASIYTHAPAPASAPLRKPTVVCTCMRHCHRRRHEPGRRQRARTCIARAARLAVGTAIATDTRTRTCARAVATQFRTRTSMRGRKHVRAGTFYFATVSVNHDSHGGA